MKKLSLLLLALTPLLATTARAQSVTLPAEVKVQPGRLAAVPITYDGDEVKWIVSKELDVFREYTDDPKVVRLRIIGYTPGSYEMYAIASKGAAGVNAKAKGVGKLSEFARCVIVVEGKPPVPPPDPDPAPAYDAFQKAVLVAYRSVGPGNAELARDLGAVYKLVAGRVAGEATAAAVHHRLKATLAEHATLKGGALGLVKQVVTLELAKLQLLDTEPLTEANRRAVADTFQRAAAVLEVQK